MKKVLVYSALLVVGLFGSQAIPQWLPGLYGTVAPVVHFLTMIGLGFIMIHVGYEFEIEKHNPRQYLWDYVVAATAATFPWLFCCLYFVFALIPAEQWSSGLVWTEALLASRFASPTSAGVLFSMLAAAGLSMTWLFRKLRVLAVFDDLDTVLLLIPLQIAIVGFRWQMGIVIIVMTVLLWAAWRYLHVIRWPVSWPWVLGYSLVIVLVTQIVYHASKVLGSSFPIHVEVLLPAFVLGCVLARPAGQNPHWDSRREGHQAGLESPAEQKAANIVSACFMLLVGLSMPVFIAFDVGHAPGENMASEQISPASALGMSWSEIALHVAVVTLLANAGKMFATFCYRREADRRQRLALGIGLWPRGEVGAGVLVLSLSYGISGPIVLVAMLSLALNLLLTGAFIAVIRRLIVPAPARTPSMISRAAA